MMYNNFIVYLKNISSIHVNIICSLCHKPGLIDKLFILTVTCKNTKTIISHELL